MTTPRAQAIRYWMVVVAIVLVSAVYSVSILDSIKSRSDSTDQLQQVRDRSAKRIDQLTNDNRTLQNRNVQLERDNAVLLKGIRP